MERQQRLRMLSAVIALVALMGVAAWWVSQRSEAVHTPDASDGLRIVSLVPSVTHSIYEMGAGEVLVGRTEYCRIPEGDSVPIVSSAVKPNIEKIAALAPDRVLASGLIPPEDVETLRKLGMDVWVLESPRSFEDICKQFVRIGELVGSSSRAREVVDSVRLQVSEIRSRRARGTTPVKIFMQLGADPLFAVVPGYYMDDLIAYVGGVNVCEGLTSGMVGRETVVSRDPEALFIVSMGVPVEDEMRRWKEFGQMSAVRSGRIFTLPAEKVSEPTPVNFLQTLQLMEHDLWK